MIKNYSGPEIRNAKGILWRSNHRDKKSRGGDEFQRYSSKIQDMGSVSTVPKKIPSKNGQTVHEGRGENNKNLNYGQ